MHPSRESPERRPRLAEVAARAVLAGALALFAACGGQEGDLGTEASGIDVVSPAGRPHRRGVALRRSRATLERTSAREGTPEVAAHLLYNGGRVLANVAVQAVFWGPTVSSEVTTGVGGFLGAVTASPYLDWLSEYSTNVKSVDGQQGTNQTIGRGSYRGSTTIRPKITGTKVTSSNVEAQLIASIAAGALPPPDPNSLYAVFFPANFTLIDSGDNSVACADGPGSWCGIHGAFQYRGQPVAYAILPDFTQQCADGCSDNPDHWIDGLTETTAHEIIEAVTDPDVSLWNAGLVSGGWYDPNRGDAGGEIADICDGKYATNGGYRVQDGWSNRTGACIAQPPAGNDFALKVLAAVTVARGKRSPVQLLATVTAGRPGLVTVQASSPPPGISWTSVQITEGKVSTGYVTVAPTVGRGRYQITLVGTGPTTKHSAALTVTVQ